MDNYFKKRLNDIKIYTCMNNKSFFGYKTNILKSGICKYFRRNEYDKFKWCIVEMALFLYHDNSKAVITNLLNRMKILLMEDMSCQEIDRCILGLQKIKQFDENGRKDISKLIEFCNIVSPAKKNRIISYVNNYYKDVDTKPIKIDNVKINKVLSFKKKNDTDELLKLGEKLIKYIENKSENIFKIYNNMIQLNGTFGNRFRRTKAEYLYFEIIKSYIDKQENEKLNNIFDFSFDMFIRNTMKERYYFGIYIGFILINLDKIDLTKKTIEFDRNITKEQLWMYLNKRQNIKFDDYVIKDYHVNKNNNLERFAKVGAFVENEDLSLLGDRGKIYKQKYIETKTLQSDSTKFNNTNNLETIDFDKFKDVEVLEKGVCGLKVPCIKTKYKNKWYVLKEMNSNAMNEGKDYMFVDSLKSSFGLIDLKMNRIRSNKGFHRIDLKKKTFVGNWKLDKKKCVYCMMKYYENIGDIGKHKDLLEDPKMKLELMKIRLFDGLFRSSDNILRNILITSDNKLISIDEGDIYGKRINILNKNDYCKKHVPQEIVDNALKELDYINKKNLVSERMKMYKFYDKINEMNSRFDNYKNIVYQEFNFI